MLKQKVDLEFPCISPTNILSASDFFLNFLDINSALNILIDLYKGFDMPIILGSMLISFKPRAFHERGFYVESYAFINYNYIYQQRPCMYFSLGSEFATI